MITPQFLLKNAYNLLVRHELRFRFDGIPLKSTNVAGKRRKNLIYVGLNRLLPLTRARGFPYMAHISPSGLCDLRCNLCPTHDPAVQGKALLPLSTFRKFIDEAGDYLLYVILWSWGEPLLNPDISTMIEYAGERGILSVTSMNLNRFDHETARRLVHSGLDALIIPLDGVTQRTYAAQRAGGRADQVIEHTKMLIEEKRRAGSDKPFINLRMVVSKENEQEVDEFRRLGRELDVDMVSFKAFSTRQLGYENPDFDRRYVPESERFRWYRYASGFVLDRHIPKYRCKFPWTKPTLFADGTVTFCEYDFYYDFPLGNINESRFDQIWFGERAHKLRSRFRRDRGSLRFCRDCVFDHRLIPGCIVEWEILKDD
jgi:radical SAM protein with 4Fe4S-binding SPASM domain